MQWCCENHNTYVMCNLWHCFYWLSNCKKKSYIPLENIQTHNRMTNCAFKKTNCYLLIVVFRIMWKVPWKAFWEIFVWSECLIGVIFSWRSPWITRKCAANSVLMRMKVCVSTCRVWTMLIYKVEQQPWLYSCGPCCPCVTWYFNLLKTHRTLCSFSPWALFIPKTWLTLNDLPVLSLSGLSSHISQDKTPNLYTLKWK